MSDSCISVIIPAFNAGIHISECLVSVLSQSEVGEVIVVDDGSTDDTRALAESFSSSDSRVKVLHQENAGVSVARNAGITAVSLPWLAFVDVDDVVPDGSFEALLNAAERYDADMTYGNSAILNHGKIVSGPDEFASFSPGNISARDMVASLISNNRCSVSGSCWRILYRTQFVKESCLRFPEGIAMSEDYCFMLDCLTKNPVIAYVNRVVYLVRREGGSTTQCYMPNLEHSMDFVNGKLCKACEGDKTFMNCYWGCVANTVMAACSNLYKENTPFDSSARRCEVRRIALKYRDAIRKVSVSSGLGCWKVFMLKVGAICPLALWAALEAKNGHGRSGACGE